MKYSKTENMGYQLVMTDSTMERIAPNLLRFDIYGQYFFNLQGFIIYWPGHREL